MTRIEWRGDRDMIRNLDIYGNKSREAVIAVAKYFERVMETAAKNNAPWTDRTGNARQTLNAFVDETSKDFVELFLAHGMEYGVYLEVRWSGKYAVIWPTIEEHLPDIHRMLQDIFR